MEYGAALAGDTISVEAVWEHGYRASDYGFQRVSRGAVQPDGGAVVADVGNREVVLLTRDGAAQGLLAAPGQGPREVSSPRTIVTMGQDTVWVEDAGNGKVMLFENGALTMTLSQAHMPGMSLVGISREGNLLVATSSYPADFSEPWVEGHIARFDPDLLVLDTVASYLLAPRVPDVGRNPFAPEGVVAATGEGLVRGRWDLPELTWLNASGEVTKIVRWRPELTYPSDTSWDEFVAYRAEQLGRRMPMLRGDRLQATVDRQLSAFSLDVSIPLPLFARIVGSPDGSVWISPFSPSGARPTTYAVVSADGMTVWTAMFPRPFSILSVDDAAVLGVHEDSLGVQAVAVYSYAER